MAKFLNDTLTGADAVKLHSHTGETGATWEQKLAGAYFEIKTNRIFCGSALTMYRASGIPANADYDVTAVIRCVTASTTGHPGPGGRVKSGTTSANATGYFIEYYNVAGAKKWRLVKCVESITPTVLGEFEQTLTEGVDYAVKLQMRGTALKVYIDGVQRISVTDETITEKGFAGCWARNTQTTTTGLHIDSISAEDPVESIPPEATTEAATAVGQTQATLHGTADPNGKATTKKFEYGKTEALGTTAGEGSAGEGTEPVAEEQTIEELEPGTKYFFRISATNADGTANGSILNFTTKAAPVPSNRAIYDGEKLVPVIGAMEAP